MFRRPRRARQTARPHFSACDPWARIYGRRRRSRYADGGSIATSFEEGAAFATATPPHGYDDEFELFVAARGPAGRFIETPGADMEINGIKFKKGRKIVYCHDLNRIADDPDRRTFCSSRRDGRSRRGWCG